MEAIFEDSIHPSAPAIEGRRRMIRKKPVLAVLVALSMSLSIAGCQYQEGTPGAEAPLESTTPYPAGSAPSTGALLNTRVPAESPITAQTGASTPTYTTKHGKNLPRIDTDLLERTIFSLVNDARLKGNLESVTRSSTLDELARANSLLMADTQRTEARSPDAGCGSSGTHVVQWPQVKSFRYKGLAAAPTSVTPTHYDGTAMEAASGVVGYVHSDEAPHTTAPHYRYIGVGAVQSTDEHGFMVFWITLYLADCTAVAKSAPAVDAAASHPSNSPITNAPRIATVNSTLAPTIPGALDSSPASSWPWLADFTNGSWLVQEDPRLARAIGNLGWVKDRLDDRESEVVQDMLYIAVTSRTAAADIVSLRWVQDGIDDFEPEAFHWLNNMKSGDLVSLVVSLAWAQDGVEETEVRAMQEISYVVHGDAAVASSLLALAGYRTESKTLKPMSLTPWLL